MNKTLKKTKDIAKELSSYRSEKFMELFFDMIEFFNSYFEKQSIEYIKSLDTYPEFKVSKMSDTEKFIKKLEEVYLLGQQEEDEFIVNDLLKVGSTNSDITISNEYALEYAEKQVGLSMSMINETTSNTINSIITTGIKESKSLQDIASEIKVKFTDYTLYRSTLIATQEISQAYGYGQKKQYDIYEKQIGISGYKRSVTQHDSNVRESHKINEDAGWIPKKQVFPGTGTDIAPHGFLCRCHIVYSLTNPDTGLLYDKLPEYKIEQVEIFNKNWGSLKELNIDLQVKQKELAGKYGISNEEIVAIKSFSGASYMNYNNGYKKASSDIMFQSGIPFLIGGLNKLPKYEGIVYRGHKTNKNEFTKLSKLVEGDIFSYNSFFSSSQSKKIAESFMGDDYKIFFHVNTKKGVNIEDFSFLPAEREVVFFPKTLFRIYGVEKNGNSLIIKLNDL